MFITFIFDARYIIITSTLVNTYSARKIKECKIREKFCLFEFWQTINTSQIFKAIFVIKRFYINFITISLKKK